jgi:hypothetical protein
MVAVPTLTAVTLPNCDTVATELSEELQVTLVLVALLGITVLVNVSLFVSSNVRVSLLRVMPVTAITLLLLALEPGAEETDDAES